MRRNARVALRVTIKFRASFAESLNNRVKTLPDYLDADLRLLSIGINPSLPAVAAGFYFANPRNRFWPALNASGLLAEPVTPGIETMALILARDRIGFTDLVKKPSAMAHHLKAADYRDGADRLRLLLEKHLPRALWFHGTTAYGSFLQRGLGERSSRDAPLKLGEQAPILGGTPVFVTPNPSPANARYSLADLTGHYRALADWLGR